MSYSNESLYGNYRNRTFDDIFPTSDSFKAAYDATPLPSVLESADFPTIWILLYAKYGNNVIASSDENRFKVQTMSLVYQYAPTWKYKNSIQTNLRNLLGSDDLFKAGGALYNHADYLGGEIPATSLTSIQGVNSQNETKYNRDKLMAYTNLYESLKDNVTQMFLEKFKKLFLTVVTPEEPLWYATEVGGEDD